MNAIVGNDLEVTEVTENSGADMDAVETMAIQVDHISEDDDEILIATEHFDAGYVGSGDFTDEEDAEAGDSEDVDTADEPIAVEAWIPRQGESDDDSTGGRAAARRARQAAAEATAEMDAQEQSEALAAQEQIDALGPRAAARRARQAEAEAAKAQKVEPGNRRHGVMGLAMALVLAYQITPGAMPGGHIGVNVFLAALATGVLIAQRERAADSRWSGQHGTVAGWVGLALLAFACWAPDPTNLGDKVSPLAVVATGLLMVGVSTEPPGPLARAFAAAPLRWLGRLSVPLLGVLAFLLSVVPGVTGWSLNAGTRTVMALAAVGIAELTMRQIARSNAAQIQRARHRSGYVLGASAVVAAVALGCTAPGQLSDRQTTGEDFVAAVEAADLPSAPVSPAANLPFGDRCWAIPPGFTPATCSFGDTDADVRVVLTGDQTAGEWLPALQGLAVAKGWQITTYLAADCNPGLPTANSDCQDWTKQVGKAVKAGGYDLVVVAGATGEAGGAFGESLRRDGLTVIGMPDLMAPPKK